MVERTTRFIICLCPECRHAAGKGEYAFINRDEEELYFELGMFHSKIRFHIHDWICEHIDRKRCLLVRDYIWKDTGGFKAIPKEDSF